MSCFCYETAIYIFMIQYHNSIFSRHIQLCMKYQPFIRRKLGFGPAEKRKEKRKKLRLIQVKFSEFFSKFFIRKNAEERISASLFMQKLYASYKHPTFIG